jgi:hypothetical protein
MRLFSNQTPILLICRAALAFSWIYQGVVPKILCHSSGEADLLSHLIPDIKWVCIAVTWMGIAEIVFGILLLVVTRSWVFWINMLTLSGLLLYVALFEPGMLTLPFNPLTLNLSLIAISAIAVMELKKIKNRN